MSRVVRATHRNRKPYHQLQKSPAELVDILRDRGLKIPSESEEDAKWWIETVGYFHLKGYLACLRDEGNPKKFRKGTSFKHASELLIWERRLRSLLMEQIGKFELRLRAALVQAIGTGSGNMYLFDDVFDVRVLRNQNHKSDTGPTARTEWEFTQDQIGSMIRNFLDDESLPITKKFRQSTGAPQIPIWYLVERMSFGNLADFYRSLAPDYRKSIAANFANPESLGGHLTDKEFQRMLTALVQFRNFASHNHVFFDKKFNFKNILSERKEVVGDPYFPDVKKKRSTYDVILLLLFLAPSFQHDASWPLATKDLLLTFPRGIPGVTLEVIGAPKKWDRFPPWSEEFGGPDRPENSASSGSRGPGPVRPPTITERRRLSKREIEELSRGRSRRTAPKKPAKKKK